MKAIFTFFILVFLVFSCEDGKKADVFVPEPIPFVVSDGYFYKNTQPKEKFFIKGVNLGVGVPGTMAGELAAQKEDYMRWFSQMSELGFNSLRIYTIHFPRFYDALAEFNAEHSDNPIYLFHGVWLDEEGSENGDLFTITEQFNAGIKEVVDVVHGNADIDHRYGRAYGKYKTNISNWIIGWIIGREVSPFEVASTNLNNEKITTFTGSYFSIEGDPAEVWFAERLDMLTDYEFENYKVKRPVSMSSWPTLDPLDHRTEGSFSFEDSETIDLNKLDVSGYEPGYFASYHAYPYYPDFMNSDPEYSSYSDKYGINNYQGYLTDLKDHYEDKPLLVAEFGVPSSIGNAHFSVSGMHHGGHDEEEQGLYIGRMFETIRDTGCAGGMYFAWIDEWWKRTWITDERDFPWDRRALWHNITAAEQNFGLISFETEKPEYLTIGKGSSEIESIEATHDQRFFYIKITTSDNVKKMLPLQIGIDTYSDEMGETVLPDGTETDVRSEFALDIESSVSQLYVTKAYDLYGIWHGLSTDDQLYHSTATDGMPWEKVKWINSGMHSSDDGFYSFPDVDYDIGKLRTFSGKVEESTLHDTVIFDEKALYLKIPWTLLQFTDPSQLHVMDDDRSTEDREVAVSEGIKVVVSKDTKNLVSSRYSWEPWDIVPDYSEREKTSFFIVKEFFNSFSEEPQVDHNELNDDKLVEFEWGDLKTVFSSEKSDLGCEASVVTVSDRNDGQVGFHFSSVKLEKGWYEYSDFSQFSGKSKMILSCNEEKFYSVGQVNSSLSMERASVRFYVDKDCDYTVLRTVDREGTFKVCSPFLEKVDPLNLSRPYVSIVFDDIWKSAADIGASELELKNMAGTFYVSKDFITGESENYSREQDIIDLFSSGHEIGYHSLKHGFLSTLSLENIDNDFKSGIEWFGSMGLPVQGIAYPFGDHDERVVSIARKYFKYGRCSFHGLNEKMLEKYGLKIFPVTNLTTVDEMKTFVQNAIDNSLWAVLLFHDLGEPDESNEYRTSLDDFSELIEFIDEKGLKSESVNTVLEEINFSPI